MTNLSNSLLFPRFNLNMCFWDNLVQPLAEADDRLHRIVSSISHLNSVNNSLELRQAYEQMAATTV